MAAKQRNRSKSAPKKKQQPKEESSDDERVPPEEVIKADDASEASTEEQGDAGYTDDNAAWLKPKKSDGLLDSSDGEGDSEDEDDGDELGHDEDKVEDDDDGDELLEIEREARLIDEEEEADRLEAEADMKETVKTQTSIYHLPTQQEIDHDANRVVPPSELRSHVDSILEVLAEFKARREAGRSRKEYIERLAYFLAELHGYIPELIEYFLTMFGPAETVEFVDMSDKPRPMVIRTNTLKTRRKDLAAALMKRGVTLDPLASWSKVGLKIVESTVPIGATPEYLTGMYMLQSAASMCPVMALDPQPKEKVLDLSSAPGGKTSYIAQLMRNTGVIFANDLKPERQKATVANMHRLGVRTVVTCAHDGRKMGHMFKNRFDRILLDAPCSGLGVISRDASVKVQRTIADVKQCAHLQKELLLAAIDSLKYKGTTGGVMVYSTCSVAIAENEEVINYALSKRDIKLIDTGLDFGQPGFTRYQEKRFHPSVALTRRFYPHVHNMDGFFVAKIQKLSDKRLGQVEQPEPTDEAAEVAEEVVDAPTPAVVKKNTKKGPKKRGRAEVEAEVPEKKKTMVSIPPKPSKQAKKKSTTSAKMTKPRRAKS